MAIYESQLKRGLSDEEAWQSSFAIATRQGQKYGWLKPGTQEPTAKGRRGAKQKLKTADAREKRQRYEQELSRRRKSGTYRIVPERHGSETWFVVQPGGKYFKGKGGMRRAKDYVAALIEEQVHGNPAPPPVAPAASAAAGAPGTVLLVLSGERRGALPAGTERYPTLEMTFTRRDGGYDEARRFAAMAHRLNPLWKEAAIFSLPDVEMVWHQRWNPRDTRRLSERGAGAYRQLGSLPKTARDLLPRARSLGQKRGGLVKTLLAVPPSKKQKFQIQRARLTRQIEDVDEDFKALLKKASYGIGENVVPDRVDSDLLRPLVRMRVHRAEGPNSRWLPLFSGDSDGRWARMLGLSGEVRA